MESFINYKDQKVDGKDHDRLVLKRNETDRSVTSLQEDTGGGMQNKRMILLNWPNFYKEIEEKVFIARYYNYSVT